MAQPSVHHGTKIESDIEATRDKPLSVVAVLKHWLVKLYFRLLLYIYYREVDVVGLENVPRDRPVIFCGNHQNQFVDGVMLYGFCPRTPGFIIAAKSMKRAIIGDFARFMDCIPVRRPQDEAVSGTGSIISVTPSRIRGHETKFDLEVPQGALLVFRDPSDTKSGIPQTLAAKVVAVISAIELEIRPISIEGDDGSSHVFEVSGVCMPFKIQPKIDQKDMWKAVFTRLKQKKCIGIFPEGGSHDQTSLLPMKDGVARFALGSLESGADPVVVPVGLTYYYGHRFRSRAHMEFGAPIEITKAIREAYQRDPSEGVRMLMDRIRSGMEDVTINAPSWKTLKIVHHARRLYLPARVKMEVGDYLRMTRNFATTYKLVGDAPDVQRLSQRIQMYQDMLKDYLLTDAQVQTLDTLAARTCYKLLFKRMLQTAMYFVIAFPGVVLNLPIAVIARAFSDVKAKEAVQNSSVKLMGNDVKASYKLMCAMVMYPMVLVVYVAVAWVLYGWRWALLLAVAIPLWSFRSVVWFNNSMVCARGTFPVLLSLHSEKYFKRFDQLYHFRRELTKEVCHFVATYMRGQPGTWLPEDEALYRRICSYRGIPVTEASRQDPFTVVSSSRIRAKSPTLSPTSDIDD